MWLRVKTNGTTLVGAPPILDYFSGDWDVHWGTIWILTHGHVCVCVHCGYLDPTCPCLFFLRAAKLRFTDRSKTRSPSSALLSPFLRGGFPY